MQKLFSLFVIVFMIFSCSKTDEIEDNNNDFSKDSGRFTDERDGHSYEWIKIGEQIWMAENLAYLPEVYPPSNSSVNEPRYYVYKYFGTNVDEAKNQIASFTEWDVYHSGNWYEKLGVFYNWEAAMSSCPTGWHLPTDDEWKELEMFMGMSQTEADDRAWRGTTEGRKLKARGGHWWDYYGGTDDFGFNGISAGSVVEPDEDSFDPDGFGGLYGSAAWWSATSHSLDGTTSPSGRWAYTRYLVDTNNSIGRDPEYKDGGNSVRCIKD